MTASGRLGVNLWRINGKTEAPEAISAFISTSLVGDKVSVARVDDAHFVVAFRNSAGKYDVISFVVDGANGISQSTELVGSSITDISVTSVNPYLGPLDQDANGG